MSRTADFIEKKYLGGKRLTRPTFGMIESLVRSYGDDAMMYFLRNDDRESYLLNKEYNNQKHFEQTLLKMIRECGYFVTKDYENFKSLAKYELQPEPPTATSGRRNKKEVRRWIF